MPARWITKRVLVRRPGDVNGFYVGPDCLVDEATFDLISNKSVFGDPPTVAEENEAPTAKQKRAKAELALKKKEAADKRRTNAEARTAAVTEAAVRARKRAEAAPRIKQE
jgi:hypothetical protein